MKKLTKLLLKESFVSCGIATGIINGVISYLTLKNVGLLESEHLGFNFFSIALGCGFICPFFSGLLLKKLAKYCGMFSEKRENILSRYVPNNLLLGAGMISVLAIALLWLIPYGIINIFGISITLSRFAWSLCLGFYSGISATFGAYFGVKRAYYNSSSC